MTVSSCPFCGTELSEFPEVMTVKPVRSEEYLLAKLKGEKIIGSDAGYNVFCVRCGAIGPRGMSKEEAKANWNRRGKKNPALYPEPEYGFKFDENKVYCVLCGNAVGHKHGNSYYLSSESEGDEKRGYCHTCVVEHCLATNCLGCDWYKYPSCPHIEMKKLYQESTANK